MANPNKAKGTAWESAVRDCLNLELGLVDGDGNFRDLYSPLNVKRAAQEGARDVGDVHAVPFILECKDVKSPAVPTFLRQAHVEAEHAGFPFGVAVVKTRGANVRRGKVHFAVPTYIKARKVLGLCTRHMYERYGFTLTSRGRDTGRWYFSTDVEGFSRVLSHIRRAQGL